MSKKNWYKVLVDESTNVDANGNVITYPAICETSNYSKFDNFEEQRKIDNSLVKRMGKSLTNIGFNNRDIIVVEFNGKYVKADGQHLAKQLEIVGLPIRFKLCRVVSLKDAVNIMREMNTTSKNWSFNQYILTCASLNKDYAILLNTFNENNNIINIKLLSGLMYCSGKLNIGAAAVAIKNGTFQLNVSMKVLTERLAIINRFYAKTDMLKDAYCALGLMSFYFEKLETYHTKEKEFLGGVKQIMLKRKLRTFGKRTEYVEIFHEVWNKL